MEPSIKLWVLFVTGLSFIFPLKNLSEQTLLLFEHVCFVFFCGTPEMVVLLLVFL